MKAIRHIFIVGVVLFVLAWLHLSSLTFFSSDTGLRFLQVRQLVANNWQTLAIDYAGRFADPTLQHTPFYYAYSVLDEQIYLNITPFFTLLASFLFAVTGPVGLAMAPVLGGLFSAWALFEIARLGQVKRPFLVLWTAVFATPLLFYSLELWDHSLATAFALWSVVGVLCWLREGKWRSLILGGVAVGLGLGQRPEMYIFALALGGGLLLATWPRWRSALALATGGLIGALPVWILQFAWVGHPLGLAFAPNLFGYGRPDAYPVQPYSEVTLTTAIKKGRLLFHVQSRDPVTFTAVLLVLVALLIIFLVLRVERYRRPRYLLAALAAALAGYGLWAWTAWQEPLMGLLTTLPLLLLALPFAANSLPGHAVYRFVYFVTGLFLLLMLALWPSFGGDQWGARYLLPAYPLLVFLAVYAYDAYMLQLDGNMQRALRRLAVGLLILSVGLQLLGIRHLYLRQAQNVAVRDSIAALPADIVLTNHPFLPSLMSSVDDKIFMYVSDEQEMQRLIPHFVANGYERMAILPLQAGQLTPPAQIGDILIRATETAVYTLESDE